MDLIKKYKNVIALLIILVVGGLIYSNVLNGPPIFDDIGYIKSNPKIHDIKNIKAIWSAWKHPARFVGYFTFALNYHFHQYNFFVYHLTNILIHLTNTVFVWLLVRLMFRSPRLATPMDQRNRDALAFMTALLFATHPMQTQAVAYMAQRFASLATLFYLASLYSYGRGRLSNRSGAGFFIVAGISALLGMFTKQITITLPASILLFEYCFLRKPDQKFRWNWTLIGAVSLFFLIVPAIFKFKVVQMLSMKHNSGSHRGDDLYMLSYLLTQFRVICTYIRLMLFPIGQNLLYDFKTSFSLFEPRTLAGFIFLVSFLSYGIKRFKNNVLITFGILWFFIALSVESSIIVIKHVIFEHRMYLPSFGFFLFISASLLELFRSQRKFVALACVIGLTLSVLTYQRNVVWTDDMAMWEDVIEKSPYKSRPYMNMGIAYLQRANWDKAIFYYNESLKRNPRNYAAFSNRGMAFFAKGLPDKSITDFDRALEIKPNYVEAYINRGNYYSYVKNYPRAIEDYNKALEISPDTIEAILNRGNKYFKLKDFDLALQDYSKTIELDPSFAKAYKSRGDVYIHLKKFDLALDDYNQVIRLDGQNAPAFYGRGNIHFKKGNLHLALNDYNKALSINPKHKRAGKNRKKLLYFMDKRKASGLSE